jgi:uncharacterized membrane protein
MIQKIKQFLSGYDRRYWILITLVAGFHLIACICTWIALSGGTFSECNPATNGLKDMIGLAPMLALTEIVLIALLLYIPIVIKEKERIGKSMIIAYVVMIPFTAFDAFNDVSVLWHLSTASATHAILVGTTQLIGVKLTCGV